MFVLYSIFVNFNDLIRSKNTEKVCKQEFISIGKILFLIYFVYFAIKK